MSLNWGSPSRFSGAGITKEHVTRQERKHEDNLREIRTVSDPDTFFLPPTAFHLVVQSLTTPMELAWPKTTEFH